MSTLNSIQIIESDYSLTDGFAWIVFSDDGKEFTLQGCLIEREECKSEERRNALIKQNKPLYKKAIKERDSGMDWGISGDVNEKAFKKFGEDECLKFFKRECKKNGIRFF
jgi:hypothetical protein